MHPTRVHFLWPFFALKSRKKRQAVARPKAKYVSRAEIPIELSNKNLWHQVIVIISSQNEITYAPPPRPHFWPKGSFQGRGVGVYILRPHAAGILYAPPFLYAPHP